MLLSELEKELFEGSNFSHFYWQNFSRREWKALRDWAEDKSIVIKSAVKGSCVVIWDRQDYLKEADRQLSDNKIYRDVEYTKKTYFFHLWIKVIEYFKVYLKRNTYPKKNFNTLLTITKMLLT